MSKTKDAVSVLAHTVNEAILRKYMHMILAASNLLDEDIITAKLWFIQYWFFRLESEHV